MRQIASLPTIDYDLPIRARFHTLEAAKPVPEYNIIVRRQEHHHGGDPAAIAQVDPGCARRKQEAASPNTRMPV
jgi:hypothetical protein